jgi:hypothetical protein
MQCPGCGAFVGAEDEFCGECGRPVSREIEPLTPEEAKDLPTMDLASVRKPESRPPRRPTPPTPAPAQQRQSARAVPALLAGVALLLVCLCVGGILFWWLASREEAVVTPVNPANLPTAETPLAIPVEPRNVIYEEDFENPDSGWDIYAEDDTAAEYVDGEYQLAVYRDNYVTWGNPIPGHDLSDFEIRVDARQVEGPQDNNFGILVRYQEGGEDFYWFQISGDGYYSVDLMRAGEWITLVGWEESEAINQGIGATNRLMLVCDGSQFDLFVNDRWLTSVSDSTFSSGNIGLAVGAFDEPGVVVRFDNLKVYPYSGGASK